MTPPLVGLAATRSAREPKSEFTRFATKRADGTQRASARNFGISTTATSRRANRSESFRSRTGPSLTSGTTSSARTSQLFRSTLPPSREMIVRGELLIPITSASRLLPGEKPEKGSLSVSHIGLLTVYRSRSVFGRYVWPRSSMRSRPLVTRRRITRIIDHDQDGSMEIKKQEGYF